MNPKGLFMQSTHSQSFSVPLFRALTAALALGLAVTGLVAAAKPADAAVAQWTVMVYMSGDNNLEDFIVKDLEQELGVAGSNANVQIVALADRGPGYDTSRGDWRSTKLYHVTPGMVADAGSAVADWGERNMGNPQTLTDFVTWSKANYPANHYALYFWGHGWSWHPGWVMEDDTERGHAGLQRDQVSDPVPGLRRRRRVRRLQHGVHRDRQALAGTRHCADRITGVRRLGRS